MQKAAVLALVWGCGGASPQTESFCGSREGDELAYVDKTGGDLSFGTYAPTHDRSQAELLEGLQRAVVRWRDATCSDVIDLSISPETWVRWKPAADMTTNGGITWGPFDDARIALNIEMPDYFVAQNFVHEIGHVLRRRYGHSAEDGSMSFQVTRAITEPVSRITQNDIDLVCSQQDCGCQVPEAVP